MTRSSKDWKRARERAVAFVQAQKNAPCTDCGERFHHAAMDFDHLPGFEKRASLSRLVDQGRTLSVLADEIAKCELVCSNCHRIRTFNRASGVEALSRADIDAQADEAAHRRYLELTTPHLQPPCQGVGPAVG